MGTWKSIELDSRSIDCGNDKLYHFTNQSKIYRRTFVSGFCNRNRSIKVIVKSHFIKVKEKWLQKWLAEKMDKEVSLFLRKGYAFLNLRGKAHEL